MADRDGISDLPRPAARRTSRWQRLVSHVDAAHIKRAVVLSLGYWFDSPGRASVRSAEAMQAENTWTAEQAARFPDRLVAFCSLNPVSDAATAAMRLCVADKRLKGVKLHFANSRVDLPNPDHVRRDGKCSPLPTEHGYRCRSRTYGDSSGASRRACSWKKSCPQRRTSPFRSLICGAAPLRGGRTGCVRGSGSGAAPGHTQSVLRCHRCCTGRNHARSGAGCRRSYSSDRPRSHPVRLRCRVQPSSRPGGSWAAFRKGIPLSAKEFAKIAHNVAPYLRESK